MAKKITSAQDSIPKQTYFSKNSKGIVSGKSGGDYLIEKMGKKPKPTAKIDSLLSGKKKVAPSVKIDSTKKVTPIGGSKPSVIIKKQTTVKPAKPSKPVEKLMPYKPAKKAIIKKLMK